jgi:predicted GNAT family acetyltransferase
MLTILDMGPQLLLYSEARKRGLSDILTNSLIEEFERENWRSPTCFEDLLEVLE